MSSQPKQTYYMLCARESDGTVFRTWGPFNTKKVADEQKKTLAGIKTYAGVKFTVDEIKL